jgi:lipopolysaccharide biosynthesis glycosyltransferase
MPVNKVVIACFKKDLFLLKACIASVRYWYPDVEIYLIKDYIQGNFSTKEMEEKFNVKIFPSQRKFFGWPWSKLAVILHEKKDKYLFLDSDVVFLGKVLDKLNQYDDDFIVTGVRESDKSSHTVNAHYIDMKKMETFDPAYQFPGFGFNGGQIVMTSGILKECDFAPVVSFEPNITNNYPDIFKHGDQGPLNYIFAKSHQQGKLKLRYEDFWIWPGIPAAQEIDLNAIKNKTGIPYVLHWAGLKPVDFRNYKRYDILKFYEDYYYSKFSGGKFKQLWARIGLLSIIKLKILKYKLLRMKYE